MRMAQMEQKRDLDTPLLSESPAADPSENGPKTWRDKHGAVVIAVGALVVVALLVALNMN
jgi:hypothetical protein